MLFQTFVEGHRFFEQYEMIFGALKQVAEVYVKSDSSSKNLFLYLYILKVVWAINKIIVIINVMLQGIKPVTRVSPKKPPKLAILKPFCLSPDLTCMFLFNHIIIIHN